MQKQKFEIMVTNKKPRSILQVCKGIFSGADQISKYSTQEKIEFTEFQSFEFSNGGNLLSCSPGPCQWFSWSIAEKFFVLPF